MKRKYYVLILSIFLTLIIAICVFVGRDKQNETLGSKGETKQNEQVDYDDEDEKIMEDQVFEEDDLTEENKEVEQNNSSKISSASDEKDPTQDGTNEETSEKNPETGKAKGDSVELPRVPLN